MLDCSIIYMTNSDYKKRMIAEMYQLKYRIEKLHKLITKAKENTLSFDLTCSVDMLIKQLQYMLNYYDILVKRAQTEGINVELAYADMIKEYRNTVNNEVDIKEIDN